MKEIKQILLNFFRPRVNDQALKFTFCMQVWGKRYVNVMLEAGLPSQLTPGNLLNFPWLSTSIYEIYTSRSDEAEIRAHPVFKKLDSLMEVIFINIDDVISDNKWSVVRHCHREGVKSADARKSALYFMCPDQIWTDGSITKAAQKISQGFSAVLCPGPRSIEEKMVPELRAKWLSDDGTSLSVPARELVKAGMRNLHPEMKLWFWDAEDYYKFPGYIFFDVPTSGMLAFCYILHPVVLNAQIRNAPFRHIFDQDYLLEACPDINRIYISQDSDEVFHFEVSPEAAVIPIPPQFDGTAVDIMTWFGERQFNEQHRKFVKKPVRIHEDEIDQSVWGPVEARGMEIIRSIEMGWLIPDQDLLETHPSNLVRRIETRYRFNPSSMTDEDKKMMAAALKRLN